MPHCKKTNTNDLEYDDPIVAEIRAIREELSDRFGGDVRAISRYYMEQQRLPSGHIATDQSEPRTTNSSEPEAA